MKQLVHKQLKRIKKYRDYKQILRDIGKKFSLVNSRFRN